ncbi:MAG TPA: DUF2905 domain-containing protein [Syntrophomonadaceae bacterium]|nr:DUF2905 domain-containing protein [Syntrophomonadaceae bacterium]
MQAFEGIAKLLIGMGLLMLGIGLVFLFVSKVGGIGNYRLPGDIYIKKENFTFFFPLTSLLIISLILTLLINFFRR